MSSTFKVKMEQREITLLGSKAVNDTYSWLILLKYLNAVKSLSIRFLHPETFRISKVGMHFKKHSDDSSQSDKSSQYSDFDALKPLIKIKSMSGTGQLTCA